jgi:GGDEF domain-containing protein
VAIVSDDARRAMLAADIALYQAKSAGRDCVVTAPAQRVHVTEGVR